MKNKQVRAMTEAVKTYARLDGKTDSVINSLLAGGGESVGRKPALTCWVATKPYNNRNQFIGWGSFVRATVKKNAEGLVHFEVEGGGAMTVRHDQLGQRISAATRRPDTGYLEQVARQAMYSLT